MTIFVQNVKLFLSLVHKHYRVIVWLKFISCFATDLLHNSIFPYYIISTGDYIGSCSAEILVLSTAWNTKAEMFLKGAVR